MVPYQRRPKGLDGFIDPLLLTASGSITRQIRRVRLGMSWQGDRILQVARRYPSHDAKQLVAWRLEEAEYDRVGARNSVVCVDLQGRPRRHGATMIGP
jgi:hypothetical protein